VWDGATRGGVREAALVMPARLATATAKWADTAKAGSTP
jgi:hypothetical protein